MAMCWEASDLQTIGAFFDESGYGRFAAADTLARTGGTVYPEPAAQRRAIERLPFGLSLLYTLFREGAPVEGKYARRAIPASVLEAMCRSGLLVAHERDRYQSSDILILRVEGLFLAVSVPPHMPFARDKKQPVYLGPDSLWLLQAIPPTMTCESVADMCAGSGVQGLVCAARGAKRVVAFEKNARAVECARLNAHLNGLADRVEVRQSDVWERAAPAERFDHVVCNAPFMPVMEAVDYPMCGAGGEDGTRVLRTIMAGLPSRLTGKGEALLVLYGLGDQWSVNFQRDVLKPWAVSEGFDARVYVYQKSPIEQYLDRTLPGNVRQTCPEVSPAERREQIRAWRARLLANGTPADYMYGEIVRVRRTDGTPGVTEVSAYDSGGSDPLVRAVGRWTGYVR